MAFNEGTRSPRRSARLAIPDEVFACRGSTAVVGDRATGLGMKGSETMPCSRASTTDASTGAAAGTARTLKGKIAAVKTVENFMINVEEVTMTLLKGGLKLQVRAFWCSFWCSVVNLFHSDPAVSYTDHLVG